MIRTGVAVGDMIEGIPTEGSFVGGSITITGGRDWMGPCGWTGCVLGGTDVVPPVTKEGLVFGGATGESKYTIVGKVVCWESVVVGAAGGGSVPGNRDSLLMTGTSPDRDNLQAKPAISPRRRRPYRNGDL